MERYKEEIELYFELKDTPQSSRESYLRRICAFLDFAQNTGHKSPPDITHKEIQQYILYLKKEKGLSAGTINNYISGIRFFYTHILGNKWDSKKIPRMKRTHVFPVIPPKEYPLKILDATTNLKHKAIFSLIYGSGLQVSEVVKLWYIYTRRTFSGPACAPSSCNTKEPSPCVALTGYISLPRQGLYIPKYRQ